MAHQFTRIEMGFPVCKHHGERCVAIYAYKDDGGLEWPARIIAWEHVGGQPCDVTKRRTKAVRVPSVSTYLQQAVI